MLLHLRQCTIQTTFKRITLQSFIGFGLFGNCLTSPTLQSAIFITSLRTIKRAKSSITLSNQLFLCESITNSMRFISSSVFLLLTIVAQVYCVGKEDAKCAKNSYKNDAAILSVNKQIFFYSNEELQYFFFIRN